MALRLLNAHARQIVVRFELREKGDE